MRLGIGVLAKFITGFVLAQAQLYRSLLRMCMTTGFQQDVTSPPSKLPKYYGLCLLLN